MIDQQVQLQRSYENLDAAVGAKRTGWLGYTIQGVFRIQVTREPAKVYVRIPETKGFIKAINDPGYYVRDESDPDNWFISVKIERQEDGEWHVLKSISELDAQLQRNPDLFLPPHMHVPADIGDDEATAGNILVSDGAGFVSEDPADTLVTHAALVGLGIVIKDGASSYLIASIGNDNADPTVDDDISLGYIAGYSWWLNTTSGVIFDLKDDTDGAAVWEARGAGGGAADFTDLGDAPSDYTGHGGKAVAVKMAEDGLEFIDFPSGGGGGGGGLRYVGTVLHDETLAAPGSFDISSIPAGYDDLEIRLLSRSAAAVSGDGLYIFFNNDTTVTNYSAVIHQGAASTSFGDRFDSPNVGGQPGASATADEFGNYVIHILGYASAKRKMALVRAGERRDGTTQFSASNSVSWENTAAIDRIMFRTDNDPTDLLETGSRVVIIGWKEEAIGGLATSSGNVSNPPTDAELDGLFGTPATVGDGFSATINDNGADTQQWLVVSNGTSWWYSSMTKAT